MKIINFLLDVLFKTIQYTLIASLVFYIAMQTLMGYIVAKVVLLFADVIMWATAKESK